jgi:hypothetical protein
VSTTGSSLQVPTVLDSNVLGSQYQPNTQSRQIISSKTGLLVWGLVETVPDLNGALAVRARVRIALILCSVSVLILGKPRRRACFVEGNIFYSDSILRRCCLLRNKTGYNELHMRPGAIVQTSQLVGLTHFDSVDVRLTIVRVVAVCNI